MELQIIEKKKNLFFKRDEIKSECISLITPSKKDLLQKISEKMSLPENQIVINKIDSHFGDKKFIIYAYAYNLNEEDRLENK